MCSEQPRSGLRDRTLQLVQLIQLYELSATRGACTLNSSLTQIYPHYTTTCRSILFFTDFFLLEVFFLLSHPVVRQCQRELVMAIGGFSNCSDSCFSLYKSSLGILRARPSFSGRRKNRFSGRSRAFLCLHCVQSTILRKTRLWTPPQLLIQPKTKQNKFC